MLVLVLLNPHEEVHIVITVGRQWIIAHLTMEEAHPKV
jgi:hypothetical protein